MILILNLERSVVYGKNHILAQPSRFFSFLAGPEGCARDCHVSLAPNPQKRKLESATRSRGNKNRKQTTGDRANFGPVNVNVARWPQFDASRTDVTLG